MQSQPDHKQDEANERHDESENRDRLVETEDTASRISGPQPPRPPNNTSYQGHREAGKGDVACKKLDRVFHGAFAYQLLPTSNGWRLSGERQRVRCSRGLGDGTWISLRDLPKGG